MFLKKAAIEIRFENEDYLIVPIGAVLVLEREEIDLTESFQTKGPDNDGP